MSTLIRAARAANLLNLSRIIHPTHISKCALHKVGFSAIKQTRLHSYAAGVPRFITRHLCVATSPRAQNDTFQQRQPTFQIETASTAELVDILENKLDQLSRQAMVYGRIDMEQVQSAIRIADKIGSLTERQSIQLLRCTGALIKKQNPENRHALFTQVWQKLPSLGVEYGTAHYNAALRIQLENEHKFSVPQVLAEMEAKDTTTPNKVTMQMMIIQYCEDGDIEGARTILEHMKSKEMPINYTVFNALVKGHMKNGDITEAREVIETMKSQSLEISPDTYKILMCAHADVGNMEELKKVIEEANAEVMLHQRHYLDTAVRLAFKGHSQFIPELLEIMPKEGAYRQDVLNAMFQLVAHGHLEQAYLVVKYLRDPDQINRRSDSEMMLSPFLRALVYANEPYETIIEYYNKMLEENETSATSEVLAIWALNAGHIELGTQCMELMKEQNLELDMNMFRGSFVELGRWNNVNGLIRLAGLFKKHFSHISSAQLLTAVYFNVLPRAEDWSMEDVLSGLKDEGYTEEECKMLAILLTARKGEFSQARELIKESSNILVKALKGEISRGFLVNPDFVGVVQLLETLEMEMSQFKLQGVCSDVLISMLPLISASHIPDLVDAWNNTHLRLGFSHREQATHILSEKGVPQNLIQKLVSIEQTPEDLQGILKRPIKEIEEMYEDWKRKRKNSSVLERVLFVKYCQGGDVDKALEMKKTLSDKGQFMNADQLRNYGELAAVQMKDLNEAVNCISQLEERYPEFSSYSGLALKVANLQISQGKSEEALETLRRFHQLHQHKQTRMSDFLLKKTTDDLMKTAGEHCNTEYCKQLIATLEECDMLIKSTPDTDEVDPIIRLCLQKGDLSEAVEKFEKNLQEEKSAIMHSDILVACAEKEETELIQKVVDLLQTQMSTAAVLNHLFLAFVFAGKNKLARKLIMNSNLRAENNIIKEECGRIITQRKPQYLENLVEMSRELPDVDREEILFQLLRLYCIEKNWVSAKETYSRYEEENIQPTDRTLRYLGKALISANLPVPFDIPKVKQVWRDEPERRSPRNLQADQTDNRAPSTEQQSRVVIAERNRQHTEHFKESDNLNKLIEAIQSRDMELISQAYKQEKLTFPELAKACEAIFSQGDFSLYEGYMKLLADNEKVDTIQEIEKEFVFSRPAKRVLYGTLLKTAVAQNLAETMVEVMGQDDNYLQDFSTLENIQFLAESCPNLLHKYGKAVESFSSRDRRPYVGNDWLNYLVYSQKYEESKAFLQKYPHTGKLGLFRICDKFVRTNNVKGLKDAISCVTEVDPSFPGLYRIYGAIIKIKVAEGDVEGGMEVVREAVDAGVELQNMWTPGMLDLQDAMLQQGQTPPWPLDIFKKRINQREKITLPSRSS